MERTRRSEVRHRRGHEDHENWKKKKDRGGSEVNCECDSEESRRYFAWDWECV
jgi:hypothetical protein